MLELERSYGLRVGMSAPDLPSRFVCQSCGLCIATSDGLRETRDDVVVFDHLHTSDDLDRGNKTVICPCCEQALGARADSSFHLRKERVVIRPERLEVLVCSLKQQEISEMTPLLQTAFPHSNINSRILLKADLRGFQLAIRPVPDLVVIAHRSEGRVLLTDRNGFYHDVLGSAWQHTRGNVIVVLTRAPPQSDSDLFDTQLLRSLSTSGDQPTIGAISTLGRVLTWESSPSQEQLKQLTMLSTKAYFRELPAAAQGIPANWSASKQVHKSGNSNWCDIL